MAKNNDFNYNLDSPLAIADSETIKANIALNDYYLLGDTRSLDKLLAHYVGKDKAVTTTLQTLKHWSSKYHWQERVKAYNDILGKSTLSGYADVQKQRLEQWSNDTWNTANELLAKANAMLNSDTDKWTMDTVAKFLLTADKLARLAVGENEAKLRANERQKTFSDLMTIMQNNLKPDTFSEVLRCLHNFSHAV